MKKTLGQQLLDYAEAHYEEDAWDVYVETTTAKELDEEFREALEDYGEKIDTLEAAIEYTATQRSHWMERRADAAISAGEPWPPEEEKHEVVIGYDGRSGLPLVASGELYWGHYHPNCQNPTKGAWVGYSSYSGCECYIDHNPEAYRPGCPHGHGDGTDDGAYPRKSFTERDAATVWGCGEDGLSASDMLQLKKEGRVATASDGTDFYGARYHRTDEHGEPIGGYSYLSPEYCRDKYEEELKGTAYTGWTF